MGQPKPPYYAVIFSSELRDSAIGYEATAARMEALAATQPGYLGFESVRAGSHGIAISYWQDTAAIADWRSQSEHLLAQRNGQEQWYRSYHVHVARVERSYEFGGD